jgi:hypothetical protein
VERSAALLSREEKTEITARTSVNIYTRKMESEVLRVRFCEQSRYDPCVDAHVVRFMAITGTGTYNGETATHGSARTLREKRKEFKEYVIECMQNNIAPHEVEIG